MSKMSCPHCGSTQSVDSMAFELGRKCSMCGKRLILSWKLSTVLPIVLILACAIFWWDELPNGVAIGMGLLLALISYFARRDQE